MQCNNTVAVNNQHHLGAEYSTSAEWNIKVRLGVTASCYGCNQLIISNIMYRYISRMLHLLH